MKEKIKQYQGYLIILILSLVCIFFLPALGSNVGLAFIVPDTPAGWLIWVVSKLAVVTINMLLFDQFVRQAKRNVKDNENFKKAQEIFNELKSEEKEELLPPKKYLGKLYRSKGIKVVVSSMLSVVAFSSAILTFDWVTMLSYLFTIIGGIVFGWITMASVEEYWTEDYYKLAIKKQKEDAEKALLTAEPAQITMEEITNNA